jgi:DNA polymerase/3'-5' exonuclease PolX
MKDIKEDLIRIFKTLYLFHSTLGRRGNQATRFRISTYGKILALLEKWKTPIYSSNDLKNTPSIGKSTLEKIDIIQRTGTHPLYEEIIHHPQYQILSSFQRVRGVGPEKAYQFYRDGYRSLAQLRKDVLSNVYPVNRDLKASFLYFDALEEKIPRREITQFTKYLEKRYQIHLINSGSYRMGKSRSGDIDLLCVI